MIKILWQNSDKDLKIIENCEYTIEFPRQFFMNWPASAPILLATEWTKLVKVRCTFNKGKEGEMSPWQKKKTVILFSISLFIDSLSYFLPPDRAKCYFCLLSRQTNKPDLLFGHWLLFCPFLTYTVTLTASCLHLDG